MSAVSEAIASLKTDICEKQNQIKELERFEEVSKKGLTEVMYHKYCETNLRYSDTLGESLLTVFPFLVYISKGVNYYHFYSKEYPNILVRIPNSRCKGVEIIVSKYHYEEETAEKSIKSNFLIRETELCRETEKMAEYIDSDSIIKRAKLMFPSCVLPLAIIKLLCLGRQASTLNIKRKYEKKLEELMKLRSTRQKRLEEAVSEYKKQQQQLRPLAQEFLLWTNEVRVYQGEATNYVTATYCMEGKNLVHKRR